MVGPGGAQSIRRRIRRELAGVYTRGLGAGPYPVTFSGVLLSCPGTPPCSLVVNSGGAAHLLEPGDIDVAQDGPEEADHLAGDGGGGHGPRLLGGESVKEGVEAMLTLPGVLDDGGILAALTAAQGRAHGRALTGVPGGLDEDVADPGVAGFGDGAEASSLPGGVLAGNETDVGHELARVLEAAHVAELGGDDHGGLGFEPAEATEAIDQGLVAGREGEVLDAAIQIVPALELVLEKGQVLRKYDLSSSARVPGARVRRIQSRWRAVQCVPSR